MTKREWKMERSGEMKIERNKRGQQRERENRKEKNVQMFLFDD